MTTKARKRRLTVPQVVQSLKSQILSGALPPGTRLRQVRLARQFGVAITALREEALMELKGAGWVDAERYRGVFVTRLVPQRILESLELRAVLEGYIARRCCQRISREGIAQLRENLRRFAEVIARDPHDAEVDELDRAFHERLAIIAGNDAMAQTVAGIRVLDFEFMHDFEEFAESTCREHLEVLEAIAHDRADDAERLMREQILALRRRVEAAIQSGALPMVEAAGKVAR